MICSREIPVPGSLPRTVRVLVHVESGTPRDVRHVYLRGARALRPDRPGGPPGTPAGATAPPPPAAGDGGQAGGRDG